MSNRARHTSTPSPDRTRLSSPDKWGLSSKHSYGSSTSTANSTGTVVHHKNMEAYGGRDLAAELGYREETEQDSSTQDSPDRPLVHPVDGDPATRLAGSGRIIVPQTIQALKANAQGFDKGDYVTRLGTEQQETEIVDALRKIQQRKELSWCQKLAFWKKK